jgi:site-specific DNA recombinase
VNTAITCQTNYFKKGCLDCPVRSISAGELEEAVIRQLQGIFTAPEVIGETFRHVQVEQPGITLPEVRAQLGNILEIWRELFPAEQTRLIRQIVREIVVSEDSMQIYLHSKDLSALIRHMPAQELEAAK